jgi:hypothetical protein
VRLDSLVVVPGAFEQHRRRLEPAAAPALTRPIEHVAAPRHPRCRLGPTPFFGDDRPHAPLRRIDPARPIRFELTSIDVGTGPLP